MKRLSSLLFAWLLIFAAPLLAHPLAPSMLEIEEQTDGQIQVI